jgi:hypothetical protein
MFVRRLVITLGRKAKESWSFAASSVLGGTVSRILCILSMKSDSALLTRASVEFCDSSQVKLGSVCQFGTFAFAPQSSLPILVSVVALTLVKFSVSLSEQDTSAMRCAASFRCIITCLQMPALSLLSGHSSYTSEVSYTTSNI